jgi:hypothetical protein
MGLLVQKKTPQPRLTVGRDLTVYERFVGAKPLLLGNPRGDTGKR